MFNQISYEKFAKLKDITTRYIQEVANTNYDYLQEIVTEDDSDNLTKIYLIRQLLAALSKKEENYSEEKDELLANLISRQKITLHELAHLVICLDLITNLQTLENEPKKSLAKKVESYVSTEVSVGMPGPCLVYLNALYHSSLTSQAKLALISCIIINLEQNDVYGGLKNKVLKLAIKMYGQLSLNFQNEATKKLAAKYEAKDYGSENNAEEIEDSIDKIIRTSLEKAVHQLGCLTIKSKELPAKITNEVIL